MFIRILLKYILGYVRITIEGYYIERFINICTNSKILIWNLKRENEVKLYLNIGIKDFYDAIKIAKKLKCKIKINKKRGIPFIIHKYKKRKIFLITLIVITMLIGVSTRFVWNIDIITEEKIDNIEQDIKEVGLKIGVPKDRVNIQEIANKIRIKRDDISWIGIELKGTNAIVKIVKAKKAPEIINENENSNIVAYKEGIITKIIAQNGTALVKVGDEVKENQILIEGKIEGKYTGTRFVHSLGEVEALVKYSRTEKFPLKTIEKVETGNKETKYKIKISNFQINFYKTLSKFKIYDTIEYAIETGTTKLEKILEDEIGKEKEIINKDVNIIETEKYIEVNVTYEVIENIGIQEREEILWKKEV